MSLSTNSADPASPAIHGLLDRIGSRFGVHIAYACEYLCSDKASYVTGQEINVNGGMWM